MSERGEKIKCKSKMGKDWELKKKKIIWGLRLKVTFATLISTVDILLHGAIALAFAPDFNP